MSESSTPLLYRVNEATRLLRVSRATIYRMINKGDLVMIKIGTATRITADSIKNVAKASANTPPHQPP